MGKETLWPPTKKLVDLQMDLINEELNEVIGELIEYGEGDWDTLRENPSRVKLAKELSDLLYVVYDAAASFGIDVDVVFAEVHKSNMSKLEDGKPVKREDGKVLKGKNYAPPNLEQLEFIFK